MLFIEFICSKQMNWCRIGAEFHSQLYKTGCILLDMAHSTGPGPWNHVVPDTLSIYL